MTTQRVETTIDPVRPAEPTGLLAENDASGLTLDSREASGASVVVFVGGELDIASAGLLFDHVRRVIDRPSAGVILDLGKLSFCDASGLRSLVQIAKYADLTGCGVALADPSPIVARVLQLGGLEHRFTVISTAEVPGSSSVPTPVTAAA